MTAAINDIIINVINGVVSATGVNFGVPVWLGFTGSRSIVLWGTGITGMVAKSVSRNTLFSLRVQVGGSIAYAIGSLNDVTITVTATTRVRDLLADFTANAPAPVKALISLAATGTGSGIVSALAWTDSAQIDYLRVEDLAQIQYYYDTTDTDYKIVRNILASAPSPGVVYLLNCYGKTGDDLNNLIALYDNGDWFVGLTGATDETTQQTIADYFNAADRVVIFVASAAARLDAVKGDHVAYAIHDAPDDHPEASWAAKNLPNVPQVDWKWTSNLYAQTPNGSATLTDLLNVRAKKGNSYVSKNGVAYMDGGQINSQSDTLYIDNVISRLWIKLNLEIDLLNLFLSASAQGRRIQYTNVGINQIVGAIANRLTNAGQLSIVAPVETPDQSKASFDGQYRFKVTALTRQQIEKSAPGDIVNRVLKGVKYSYIEAGAIEKVEVTGVILLTEG